MMRNFQDRLRPRVRTACHVLLPRLCVAGQHDARPAVAKEDGHRVVVGLGEELPWRRRDDVDRLAPRPSPAAFRCEAPRPSSPRRARPAETSCR